MDIRLTRNTVEVFMGVNRVALHLRKNALQKDPIINPDHMTPEHRKYLNYNAEDFTLWAKDIRTTFIFIAVFALFCLSSQRVMRPI